MVGTLPDDLENDWAGVVRTLCEFGAPSGHEDSLVQFIYAHLVSRGLTPKVDRLGQISVSFGGGDAEPGNCILVTAHLDQLGLVVSNVRPDGYIKFERLGGVPERVLPGTRMRIHAQENDVPAVVGLKSHHLTPAEEKYRALPSAELYLDVGASDAADVKRLGVRTGDACTYEFGWTELANGRVSTTSLDNRLGVAALLALIDRSIVERPAGIVHFAFSTQEEFHVRGTLALVERLRPDIVVNIDISPATDTPDLNGQTGVRLGGGPVINRLSFHGRGTLGGLIPHPGLLKAAVASAEAVSPAYQFEAIVGLISDAAFVPMATGEGVATLGISIPARYTHSPIETAQLSDLDHTVELVNDLVARARDIDLTRFTAV